jgi:hypothetical protein
MIDAVHCNCAFTSPDMDQCHRPSLLHI